MIIEEKTNWKERTVLNGASQYLLLSKDILEYLEIKKIDGEDVFAVSLMADKGKHGKFIAIWKAD